MNASLLGRVQIVDAPPAAPGHCAICGTTQGPMIDFGMNVEFFGVIYLCVDNCMVELANSFDYHSPRQWKMVMNQVEQQRDEINQLRDQNEQLRNSIDSLTPLASLHFIDRVPELDVDALRITDESEPEQLAFDFTEEGNRSPEPINEQRSADVLRDDRDDLSIDDFLRDI